MEPNRRLLLPTTCFIQSRKKQQAAHFVWLLQAINRCAGCCTNQIPGWKSKAELEEGGYHGAKWPITGQDALRLHNETDILHTWIMQRHFAFGWESEIQSGGQRKKIAIFKKKQIILANSLEVVSSLMNFNAGYQLESKQFQRNQRSFAALSFSLLRKLSVREDVNRAWESSLITFCLPSISTAWLSPNHVLALWIMLLES